MVRYPYLRKYNYSPHAQISSYTYLLVMLLVVKRIHRIAKSDD